MTGPQAGGWDNVPARGITWNHLRATAPCCLPLSVRGRIWSSFCQSCMPSYSPFFFPPGGAAFACLPHYQPYDRWWLALFPARQAGTWKRAGVCAPDTLNNIEICRTIPLHPIAEVVGTVSLGLSADERGGKNVFCSQTSILQAISAAGGFNKT